MSKGSLEVIGALTVILGVFVLLQRAAVPVTGQAQTATAKAAGLKTPWGDADLQGIWSVELLVPLARPPGVTSEFYTEKEIVELDRERAKGAVFGNEVRGAPGSAAAVATAANGVDAAQWPTGSRLGVTF